MGKSIFLLAAMATFAALGVEPAKDTLIAHRGGVDAPENTLAAFKASVDAGFGFECDVYRSKDGRVFTFHDNNLKKLSGGTDTRNVGDLTWEEISQLNVAGKKWEKSKFDPSRPALLEEVLDLARDGRFIFVEVKHTAGEAIAQSMKEIFASQTKANPGNVYLLVGRKNINMALKAAMPEYKTLLVPSVRTMRDHKDPQKLIAMLRDMGVDGVDAPFFLPDLREFQTAEYVKAVKDAGFEYHIWNCNRYDEVEAAFARGIQTVTTDVPKEIMKEDAKRKDFARLVEKKAAPLEWLYPSGDERPHEGMAFADGVSGVLAWGGGDTLKLTIGRSDLWDHRGGYEWTDAQSYTNITDAILKGDKERLLGLFKKEVPKGEPRNPFMLPLGRIEVKIPGATLKRGTLDVKTGLGTIEFELEGKMQRAQMAMSKASRAFALKLPDGIAFEAKAINSMEFPAVGKWLSRIGFHKAKYSADGFTWELPADESVTLHFEKNGSELAVRTWRGEAKEAFAPAPFAKVRAESAEYWAKFWAEGARVKVPDPVIQGMFDYGMYRFGAMTDPDGVPAGLQGPWLEDNDIPPWSGDYHFNINVQECYSPVYRGGHFANMMPLFKMILSWKPILRDNARKFAGVEGYVLPHSVSDKGVNIGGFWTGTIDHGSAAWVADMMWRYVKYSGDAEFLRRDAYDFMKGAMAVYRAMMTEDESGSLAFPTGPSPEWGGSDFNTAVGRNPSFQLAAAHRLARDLIAAAAMLGEEPDAMWLDVERRLPPAAIGETGIEIFERQALTASHRHHSHMAGLFPFDIFDLSDPATAAFVDKTYDQWRAKGTGGWKGWCVPWAAVLCVHAGRAEDAVNLLHKWDEYFTNPGHASRHNKWKPGFGGGFGRYPEIGSDGRPKEHEVMQMDGQCAFAAAVLEMMAHEVNGKTEFFKGCPDEWKEVSFENIALSDGRRANGRRVDGKIEISFADRQ